MAVLLSALGLMTETGPAGVVLLLITAIGLGAEAVVVAVLLVALGLMTETGPGGVALLLTTAIGLGGQLLLVLVPFGLMNETGAVVVLMSVEIVLDALVLMADIGSGPVAVALVAEIDLEEMTVGEIAGNWLVTVPEMESTGAVVENDVQESAKQRGSFVVGLL